MSANVSDKHITIRELQRNAAEVFDRAQHGQSFVVTRRGETVARILPPDPADEAVQHAVAEGVLDPAVLDSLPEAGELPTGEREPSPTGTRLGSEAIQSMREDDRA